MGPTRLTGARAGAGGAPPAAAACCAFAAALQRCCAASICWRALRLSDSSFCLSLERAALWRLARMRRALRRLAVFLLLETTQKQESTAAPSLTPKLARNTHPRCTAQRIHAHRHAQPPPVQQPLSTRTPHLFGSMFGSSRGSAAGCRPPLPRRSVDFAITTGSSEAGRLHSNELAAATVLGGRDWSLSAAGSLC